MNTNDFLTKEESTIGKDFLDKGYYIFPLNLDTKTNVFKIREDIFNFSKNYLKLSTSVTIDDFFNHTETFLSIEKLNDLKLQLINLISQGFPYHVSLYHMAKKYIDIIVGNEICMQRALNLSIQLPLDDSALLPIHTDVWSGNSPYEIVFWMPLVNCFKTKSMYVLPIEKSLEVFKNFKDYQDLNAEGFYRTIEKDVIFVDVPQGSGIIFSHSILHGNRVNQENDTRWTFNIRFKSVFSPYGTKSLGESFIPITLKPATRVGYNNIIPQMQ